MNELNRIVTLILRKNLALPSGATQNFLSRPDSGAGPLFSTRLQLLSVDAGQQGIQEQHIYSRFYARCCSLQVHQEMPVTVARLMSKVRLNT